MKLIHLSDLHLGKRVNEYSMIEDQKYILKKILNIIDDEAPDAVIIAGDVYDKSIPSVEAVELFDEFLVSLSERSLTVFVLSGNHDSAERIAFGSRLMDARKIYMSPVYNGSISPITLKDEYGEAYIYMLPFVKPAHVRRFFEEETIESYTDAMRVAISNMNIDKSKRNVLVTHQFVTGASRSESENISVGGTDNVDGAVFEAFDYVALGHIHSPQKCGSEHIRYCGTPLKYSFSEAKDNKSVTVLELCEKGSINIRTVPLIPMRDMVEIRGKYDELMSKSFYDGTTYGEDYMHITLTDEESVPNVMGKLRTVYHNIMKLDYDNIRTRSNRAVNAPEAVEKKTPIELFADFYENRNNQPMSDEQRAYINDMIESIWEGRQ